MPRSPRAVVFDLDDTLYPYRQFRASGFKAVARYLARTKACDRRAVFAALVRSSRGRDRGRELQRCLAHLGLPDALLGEIFDVFREHRPDLRLPLESAAVLDALGRAGWRIGVLTNGDRATQARKVAALDLRDRVDGVVYAETCGRGAGKPDPLAFHDAMRQLDVSPARAVMVGNDEHADVGGALAAGMHAVLCRTWVDDGRPTRAHRIVTRLSDVPAVALALLEGASTPHAA